MAITGWAERQPRGPGRDATSSPFGPPPDRPGGARWRPLVIGHRGASAHAPENSLEAFRLAAAQGADGVELDVLCCATGEVVVFHDDDLVRLASRRERIADLSFAALREVRLRSGAAIPTLEEALQACGPKLLVNVELKATGLPPGGLAKLVAGVARTVARTGTARRILISSFSPWALWLWRRANTGVPFGLLFERDAPLPLRRAWPEHWLQPWALHPEAILCDEPAVRRWHGRGRRVHIWTVDDPAALERFCRMGVDAIITNDPARARSALEASGTS